MWLCVCIAPGFSISLWAGVDPAFLSVIWWRIRFLPPTEVTRSRCKTHAKMNMNINVNARITIHMNIHAQVHKIYRFTYVYIYIHISHKRIITDNHQEWATMFYPAMKRINFFWQTTRCERRNSFDHVGQSHIAGKRFPVLRLNCRFFSGQPVDILQSSPKRFKKMYHQNIREKDVSQSFRDDIPTIFQLYSF